MDVRNDRRNGDDKAFLSLGWTARPYRTRRYAPTGKDNPAGTVATLATLSADVTPQYRAPTTQMQKRRAPSAGLRYRQHMKWKGGPVEQARTCFLLLLCPIRDPPTEIESMGTRPSLAHRPEVRIKGENEVLEKQKP